MKRWLLVLVVLFLSSRFLGAQEKNKPPHMFHEIADRAEKLLKEWRGNRINAEDFLNQVHQIAENASDTFKWAKERWGGDPSKWQEMPRKNAGRVKNALEEFQRIAQDIESAKKKSQQVKPDSEQMKQQEEQRIRDLLHLMLGDDHHCESAGCPEHKNVDPKQNGHHDANHKGNFPYFAEEEIKKLEQIAKVSKEDAVKSFVGGVKALQKPEMLNWLKEHWEDGYKGFGEQCRVLKEMLSVIDGELKSDWSGLEKWMNSQSGQEKMMQFREQKVGSWFREWGFIGLEVDFVLGEREKKHKCDERCQFWKEHAKNFQGRWLDSYKRWHQ